MSETPEHRIRKLNQALLSLKKERNELNQEARKWAEKRDGIHSKIKDLQTKAAVLRKKRDTLTKRVQDLKNQRDQARVRQKENRTQIMKLREKIRSLKESGIPKGAHNIQMEIEKIEWTIQTTSLPVKEEEKLINQVRKLEAQLSTHRKLETSQEELMTLQTKEEGLETDAKAHHEKLLELAEESQKSHEEMLESLREARSLKADADSAHQNYVEIKQQSKELHQKCIELSDTIKTHIKELQELDKKKQAKRQRELLKELEERALEKLRHGEKLTWEEFKILTEKGKL